MHKKLANIDKAHWPVLRSSALRLPMPTKTKKEKLLSELHRKSVSIPSDTRVFNTTQTQPHSFSMTSDLRAVRADITKTILLGFIGIVAELGLYWYTINRF